MTVYRNNLPQLSENFFLADGGMETTLLFHNGLDMPYFAAFHLLKQAEGQAALRDYYRTYINLAKRYGVGIILDSNTWRASIDWGTKLGYTAEHLATMNRMAVSLVEEMRSQHETPQSPIVISGCIGPRGDGYNPAFLMKADEAQAYHTAQAQTLSDSAADMISALTITYSEEAIGIVRAAQAVDMPCVISFTVETDGHLPTGQPLAEAITQVDNATDGGPIYYMINCAHPTHFEDKLDPSSSWAQRIRALRANASTCSHAELDEATELDDGNPTELGGQYRELQKLLPNLTIMGGCCGTDHRHLEAICRAVLPVAV